jgi:acid phosphatase (class B)
MNIHRFAVIAALSLLAASVNAEDRPNLNPGITTSEILETAPVHWVSIDQIAASLEGQPPMVVGFDVDDTVLFSSPCFYYGKMKYSPLSEDYLKMNEFWVDIHTSGCDQYSIPKEVARQLINLHTKRGDDIYFITGRTKGSPTETLTEAIKKAFVIEKMNDVVFTASSENKLQFLKDHKLKIYYGDADSDMKAAIDAGIRPVRVLRAQNSTYKPEPKNGKFGEEVIVNSTN